MPPGSDSIRQEIGHDDLTGEQQRIVDAGNEIAGQFPEELRKDELSAWIKDRYL